jgi:hypothetical protein
MLNLLSKLSNTLIDKRSHLSNFLMATRIQKLLVKNQIKILHYLPGRIRLKSPLWINKTNMMKCLEEELEKEPRIVSVTYTKELGSLLILFDKSPLKDYSQIEHWLKKAEYITHNFMQQEGGGT